MKKTEEQLLKAGLDLFSSKGYVDANTKEIANLAGVSEMTLFRRFESKQQLFISTIRYALKKQRLKQRQSMRA